METPNKSSCPVGLSIKMDGKVISEPQVKTVLVQKEVGKIPFARMVIIDGNVTTGKFETSSGDDFVPGNAITIMMGYGSDQEKVVFKGIITKQKVSLSESGETRLCVEARDEAVKMTIGKKNKYFYKKKDSEVFTELIGTYGLKKTIEATKVTHAELIQYYATDWDFMSCRAEANGKLIFVNDGEIEVKAPDLAGASVLDLILGENILSFEAETDARHQLKTIKSDSWNYADQAVATQKSNFSGKVDAGNLTADTLADVIGLEEYQLQNEGLMANDELKEWANAQMQRRRLALIRGTVCTYGEAAIKPGDSITLEGVGKRFSGKLFVAAVQHQAINGLWNTTMEFGLSPTTFLETTDINQPPASGLLPAINGVHVGIVNQLEEDPDGEDRLLVSLPILGGDEEGVWARVARMDAGENRGAIFNPEVGDEVLVAFINNDPRKSVIIGMLNSSAKPSPLTATAENELKGFVTRSEIKFLFDDNKKILTAEMPSGKTLKLDDDAGEVSIVDENGNKLVLDSSGITIESAKDLILKATGDVKVEGTNIESTAKASFKAKGNAGLDLQTSAVAVLKGSVVQIN